MLRRYFVLESYILDSGKGIEIYNCLFGNASKIQVWRSQVCYQKWFPLLSFFAILFDTSSVWYCGWLGQQRQCYNTNTQKSFSNARLSFQNSRRVFGFLFSLQKPGGVFRKLEWVFQRLCRVFWSKCSKESFDQQTNWEYLKIWSVKSKLHTSNKSLEHITVSHIYFQF